MVLFPPIRFITGGMRFVGSERELSDCVTNIFLYDEMQGSKLIARCGYFAV